MFSDTVKHLASFILYSQADWQSQRVPALFAILGILGWQHTQPSFRELRVLLSVKALWRGENVTQIGPVAQTHLCRLVADARMAQGVSFAMEPGIA